jgi:Cu+-exporting ATPase
VHHHIHGKAIMKKAQEQNIQLFDVENFKVEIGKGLEATRGQNRYFVGNEAYLAGKLMPEALINLVKQEQNQARTLVFVARDNHMIGLISLEDTIKESSREAIQEVHHLGLEVVLISGDQPTAAQAVANQLAIKEVYAGVLPQEKALILTELQERFGKVAMVGDGINDAVALARADVGIAVASGTQIAMSSADIILMKSDLRDVALAIFLSKKTIRNIKENLFWAFGYNLIGLPIAAGLLYPFGLLLNPMIAALAMAFSSVSVVLNALRLKKAGAKLFSSK